MPGALGASGAVNACVIFAVLVQPTATVLLYGIIPLPAFLFGGLWLLYDLNGAVSQVYACPMFVCTGTGLEQCDKCNNVTRAFSLSRGMRLSAIERA